MKRVHFAVVAAAMALSACAELGLSWDDPCYSCGQNYQAQSTCTYDYNGVPSPGCYDYLFTTDDGTPVQEVIVVDGGYYANGEFHPDPETDRRSEAAEEGAEKQSLIGG